MDNEADDMSDSPLLPDKWTKLDPEEALRGFMEVDPEKVKERLDGYEADEGDE